MYVADIFDAIYHRGIERRCALGSENFSHAIEEELTSSVVLPSYLLKGDVHTSVGGCNYYVRALNKGVEDRNNDSFAVGFEELDRGRGFPSKASPLRFDTTIELGLLRGLLEWVGEQFDNSSFRGNGQEWQ